jgi:hypothetical protein
MRGGNFLISDLKFQISNYEEPLAAVVAGAAEGAAAGGAEEEAFVGGKL